MRWNAFKGMMNLSIPPRNIIEPHKAKLRQNKIKVIGKETKDGKKDNMNFY